MHHIRGHIAANYLAYPELEPPFLCLVVSGGTVKLDMCYGGNFYAIIPAASVGLDLNAENYSKLIAAGIKMRGYINDQLKI